MPIKNVLIIFLLCGLALNGWAQEQTTEAEPEVPPPTISEELSGDQNNQVPPAEPVMSEPNAVVDQGENIEDRFHKIYTHYNSKPTPQETWSLAFSKKNVETYEVTQGDTLWDISQTLFGDGFFWSKVWSLNPEIKNPHRIKPGNKIQFMLGSGMTSPSLMVVEGANKKEEEGPRLVALDGSNLNGVKIPAVKPRSPVPIGWPESLPTWTPTLVESKDGSNIQVSIGQRSTSTPEVVITHYVTEEIADPLGTIKETEHDGKYAFLDQVIYIEGEGGLKIGGEYTVVKDRGTIDDPDSWTSDFSLIEVLGQVKVIGKYEDYYKAKVIHQIMPIEVGAVLVSGPYKKVALDPVGSSGGGVGVVMGGEHSTKRNLLGLESFIFLNKGSESGFAKGQDINIFGTKGNRFKNVEVKDDRFQVARARIVDVEKNCATAIILSSSAEVVPGDAALGGSGNGASSSESLDEESSDETLDSDSSDDSSDSLDDSSGDDLESDSNESNEDALTEDAGEDDTSLDDDTGGDDNSTEDVESKTEDRLDKENSESSLDDEGL